MEKLGTASHICNGGSGGGDGELLELGGGKVSQSSQSVSSRSVSKTRVESERERHSVLTSGLQTNVISTPTH